MELKGVSLIAGKFGTADGAQFRAVSSQTEESIEPQSQSSTIADVDGATHAAQKVFVIYGQLPERERGRFCALSPTAWTPPASSLPTATQLKTALPEPRL